MSSLLARAALPVALIAFLVPVLLGGEPPTATLSSDGAARLAIVVGKSSSPRVKEAARTLAQYLERISGARFEVKEGPGMAGIAVGLFGDFPDLGWRKPWEESDPTQREHYLLRSHARGLALLGASELAVEHAVWDLLHRLGYRQFFPGSTWEVVPRQRDLRVAVDVHERPAFHARRIWYGYGTWGYNDRPYAEWCARNRAVSGIVLRSGHAYEGIRKRHEAIFKQHPEYLGLVKGERTGRQFCQSNPAVRKLILDDVLQHMERDPSAQSLSLEPADGGGWCECANCKKLGSPSDRALRLANEAAALINEKYPGRFVGMYAYSQHSPPPSIDAHPRVVISVATGFITGGYTLPQLLEGWQKRKATLGIREYYSVHTWDRDLPGAARGSRLNYLKTTIPEFHARGAQFFSAESSDNWGPNGLGYYIAARLLWDPTEAKKVDAHVSDFLEKAFGPAREPMQRFYNLLNGERKPLLSADLVGRFYRLLSAARGQTAEPAIHRRIDELVQYARYVDLWLDYASATGEARQKVFESLIKHGYRMRTTMLIHAKGLYRDLAARDKSVTIPKEAAWNVPEGKNPWKSSAPFTATEIEGLLKEGIARRQLFNFEPVAFSSELVPATKLKLPEVKPGTLGLYSRGVKQYLTWAEKEGTTWKFTVSAGRIYQNKGSAKLALYPELEVEGKAVATGSAPPDKKDHPLALESRFTGLHRLEVSDSGAGTVVAWPEGLPLTVASSPENPATFHGRWTMYFYVPKGTKVIGGFASGPGILKDGAGNKAHIFVKEPGYFSVPVPAGQDGQLWKFENSIGQRLLMTVPPYLARNGRELLLPREVVERDAR